MRPTPHPRPLSAGLALAALALALVACGPAVSGTAAPATAETTGTTTSSDTPITELSPVPSLSLSTVSSSDVPPTSAPTVTPMPTPPATPVPTPSVDMPDVPVPVLPTEPAPSTTPADPVLPSVPQPDPDPEPEPQVTGVVDAQVYWSDAVGAYAWRSPSSNLLCELRPADDAVACVAFEHTIAPVEGCYPDQPVVAELSPGNVIQGCAGDVPYSGEILPYNSTIVVGTITCSSSETGMVCDNGDLAFMLSRTALDFAG